MVGNQIARLQRVAHSFGAHRNAVTDADGVETHPHEPGRLHPLPHPLRKIIEVHIACIALVPDAGDPDLRFDHVLTGQSGAVQHGLGGAL
jgi:hypothetical protein